MNARARRLRGAVLALVAMLAPACSWLGASDIEPDAIANLPVVADGPFDPSQAVDDDDDLERPWLRAEDEQEQDAFANAGTSAAEAHPTETKAAEATAPRDPARAESTEAGSETRLHSADAASTNEPEHLANRAPDRPAAPPAKNPTEDAAKNPAKQPAKARDAERAVAGDTSTNAHARGGKVGPKLPDDEHVASPEEAETLRAERRRKLDELVAAKGDDAAKLALARNPPPEPIGPSKSTAWTVADYALEGVLLAIAAGVVAGAWSLARSFPKSVASAVVVAVLVMALVITQGE